MDLASTSFKVNISTPFIRGVESLGRVVTILQSSSNYTNFQEEQEMISNITTSIDEAYKQITIAMKKAEAEKNAMDKQISTNVERMGDLQQQIKNKEKDIAVVVEKVKTLSQDITDANKALTDAKSNLSSQRDTLSTAESDLAGKEIGRGITTGTGAALLLFPGVGWIVGGTMIAVSETALRKSVNAARDLVEEAERHVKSCEKSVTDKENTLESRKNEKSAKENERDALLKKEKNLKILLKAQRDSQNELAEVNRKLKNCLTFISTTRGRTAVLHGETEVLYNLQQLICPLRDIAEHFLSGQVQSSTNDLKLLFDANLDFLTLGKKLKALQWKTQRSDEQWF